MAWHDWTVGSLIDWMYHFKVGNFTICYAWWLDVAGYSTTIEFSNCKNKCTYFYWYLNDGSLCTRNTLLYVYIICCNNHLPRLTLAQRQDTSYVEDMYIAKCIELMGLQYSLSWRMSPNLDKQLKTQQDSLLAHHAANNKKFKIDSTIHLILPE